MSTPPLLTTRPNWLSWCRRGPGRTTNPMRSNWAVRISTHGLSEAVAVVPAALICHGIDIGTRQIAGVSLVILAILNKAGVCECCFGEHRGSVRFGRRRRCWGPVTTMIRKFDDLRILVAYIQTNIGTLSGRWYIKHAIDRDNSSCFIARAIRTVRVIVPQLDISLTLEPVSEVVKPLSRLICILELVAPWHPLLPSFASYIYYHHQSMC